MNTVARAYQALEAAGLVVSVRGRGTTVLAERASASAADPGVRDGLRQRWRAALADARLAGMARDEVRALLLEELEGLWPAEGASR
jgi:DNA-binding transcriptional regulator YhcF (GntR family)